MQEHSMAPDGLDSTMTATENATKITTENRLVILPDLLALTGAAVAPIEALFETARENLRVMVSDGGRISGALIEANQTAAHGLSWLATYTEALRQMQAWAVRLQEQGKFTEIEQLIHQIAFGEYLWQIYGGIPMSQGEIMRLQDIGLSQDRKSVV